MKNLLRIAMFAIVALSFVACNDGNSGMRWGKTKYYNDSFLKKYKPVVMSKTLEFGLNEDGQSLSDVDFSFRLYEEMPNGQKVLAPNVILYKNGEPCENNVFKVKGGEGRVEVGIEFTANATEGYHKFFLKEVSLNGLDRIEYLTLGQGFIAEKSIVMNPADKLVMWILILLVSAYVAWVVLLRPIFCPHLRFSNVYITYPGCEEIRVRTSGYCDLILSNKPIKQSFFRKIFFTQSKVEVNELWTSKVRIKSGRAGSLNVYTMLDVDPSPNDSPERKEKFTIINEENQKIGIETT